MESRGASLLDLSADPRSGWNGRRTVIKLAMAQAIHHVAGVAVMIDQTRDLQHGDVAGGVVFGGCGRCRTDGKRC